jgi:AAA domain
MTDGIQEHDLPDRIVADSGVDRQQVLRIFQECNLPLATGAALPRPLQVHRLRIAGDRTVKPAGPFDQQINFGNGVTALVAHNLKGKTSVLELITWCLRGSHRDDLQGVVKSWLSHLDCDAVVAGRPLGFRLRLERGEVFDARVLSAPSLEQLREASASQPGAGVRELLAVQDETAYAAASRLSCST